MDALEIEGDKHNVVYIWRGKASGVSVVAHVHKAHHTRLRTEQDFVGGWVAKGLCHKSHQFVVTYLSNKKNDTSLQLLDEPHADKAFET